MLAQNFKTAEELRIPEGHVAALQKVLVLLETDKLTHMDKELYYGLDDGPRTFTGHFNMGSWTAPRECGTVACIGGTAELISGLDFSFLADRNPALNILFYPCIGGYGIYNDITTEQAAQALRNYLTTGVADWWKVLNT